MIRNTAAKRMRFTPLALTTVLLSAGLLSLSVTGTLSGFTAAITNSANTAASGTLTLQESNTNASNVTTTCNSTDGGSVSTNTATCSTINKFGGSTTMVPGGTAIATTVVMKNTGTVPGTTFTLAPSATCSQSNSGTPNGSATDFCSKMNLTVTQNGTSIFSGTLASFGTMASKTLTPLAAGGTSTFVFTVQLDSSAGNTYQGLQASVPMTWTLNS